MVIGLDLLGKVVKYIHLFVKDEHKMLHKLICIVLLDHTHTN